MKRPLLVLGAAALLAAGLGFGLPPLGDLIIHAALSKPTSLPEQPVAITVDAQPIVQFRPGVEGNRFGALTFLGGLVLTSTSPVFGGISGLTLSPDGRDFLAVTDAGVFLSGKLKRDGERPVGLEEVKAAALKDYAGRLQAQRGRGDSESLTLAPDAVYVGFESVNEIWRYPRPPLGEKGVRVPAPEVRNLRFNLGLESLEYVPSGPLKGALIGIGEEGETKDADLPGFIIGGPHPGTFTIKKSSFFDATDISISPKGDLFLLERHFSLATGVLMQIRRFRLAEVKPGAVLTGEVLGTFDNGYDIDNMEGLAATIGPSGETLLTLISDDNFSPLQRTVLLRFSVEGR